MEFPLIVELAEIRLAEVDILTLPSSLLLLPLRRRWMWSLQKQRPRKSLPFLFSSLTEDLTFTMEHPTATPYGSLPFLDVLFHTDKFYCFSEAPIKSMTYLYTKYSSCTSNQSRIIRSLTGRAVPTTSAPLST